MLTCESIPAPIARFFPGQFPEDIENSFPMYPLLAPGVPHPGPDFVAHAAAMGDTLPINCTKKHEILEYLKGKYPEDVVATFKKMKVDDLTDMAWRTSVDGGYLETICRAFLYTPQSLPINVKGRRFNVQCVPGHLWGAEHGDLYGPEPADVMVVGKCLGREETLGTRNFVGKSSKELTDALDELGVDDSDRAKWYVANVIKHEPPTIDDRIPVDWLRNFMPLLHQELRLVRPKFLLCLGADAGKALLGRGFTMNDGIGRIYELQIPLQQSVEDPEELHTVKVVCCSHPAKVYRDPELYDKPEFMGSLRLFVDLVQGRRTTVEETDLERDYVYNEMELDRAVEKALKETEKGGIFALDCEWHGAYPWSTGAYLRTIQWSHRGTYACAILLRHAGGKKNEFLCEHYVVNKLNQLLKSTPERPIRLVGHNLKADLVWTKAIGLDLDAEYEVPDDEPGGRFGWERTKTEGAVDTMYAAHAHTETGPFKLEIIASNLLGTPRYDAVKEEWLKQYCKEKKIKRKNLEGYGDIPDEILLPYGAYDADTDRRLMDVYNGVGTAPGLLDCDKCGNSCREAFWVSMRAAPAFMEIETVGLPVDRQRAEQQTEAFSSAKERLLASLRTTIHWPDFNPNSHDQVVEFMFGEGFKFDADGKFVRLRPPEARTLGLGPVMTTEGRAWEERGPGASPSTDKTVIGILAPQAEEIRILRDIRFLSQTLRQVLKPPTVTEDDTDNAEDDDPTYEGGLLKFVSPDGRVRTRVYPVETGRISSSKPNLQNYSNARDVDYHRILGAEFKTLRGLFLAPPGCVLMEADYTGAELAITGWLTGDQLLSEHCARALLPEKDPNYYDIHASVAVKSFNLKCPPTKKGLKEAGLSHLRTAAKRRAFGLFYGQADAGALLKIQEECPEVTLEQVQQTTLGIHKMYPCLNTFFNAARARVTDPGWMCNPFGRFRRFATTSDRQKLADLERQAMNFDIQSTVGDAVSRSLDNLRKLRAARQLSFQILLQIHDAVLLAVPIPEIQVVHDEIFPKAMCEMVPIVPCDFDGLPTGSAKHLGIDIKLGLRWGEELTVEQAKASGIPERYAA